VTFAVASAEGFFPGRIMISSRSSIACMIWGDPVGAAAHVKKTLAPGGTWMIVEPFANDEAMANHNPIGRIYYYSASATGLRALLAGAGGWDGAGSAGWSGEVGEGRSGWRVLRTSARLRRRRSISY